MFAQSILAKDKRKQNLKVILRAAFLNGLLALSGLVCLFLTASIIGLIINEGIRGVCAPSFTTLQDQCENKNSAEKEKNAWQKTYRAQFKSADKQLSKLLLKNQNNSGLLLASDFKNEDLDSLLDNRKDGAKNALAFLVILRQDATKDERAQIDEVVGKLYNLERTHAKYQNVYDKFSDVKLEKEVLIVLAFGLGALISGGICFVIFISYERELRNNKVKYLWKDFTTTTWLAYTAPAITRALRETNGAWTWSQLEWLFSKNWQLARLQDILPADEKAGLDALIEALFCSDGAQHWKQANANPPIHASRQAIWVLVANNLPIAPKLILAAIDGKVDLQNPQPLAETIEETKQPKRHANPLATR
jgi:hypothetical protein